MLRFFTPQGRYNRIIKPLSVDVVRSLNNIPVLTITLPHSLQIDRFISPTITFDWTLQKNVAFVGGSGFGSERSQFTVEDIDLDTTAILGRAEIFTSADSSDETTLTEAGLTIISKNKTRPTQSADFNNALKFGEVFELPLMATEFENNSLAVLDVPSWQTELWRLKRVTLDENEAELQFRGLNSLLEDRIVLDVGPLTGHADDLAKLLARNAMTIDERSVPRLSVANDLSKAPIVTIEDIRYRPLFDVLTDLADLAEQKGTAFFFNIESTSDFALRFSTFAVELGGNKWIADTEELKIRGGDFGPPVLTASVLS